MTDAEDPPWERPDSGMTRRNLLATATVGWLAASAGCTGGDADLAAAATPPTGQSSSSGNAGMGRKAQTSEYGFGGYGLGGYGGRDTVTATITRPTIETTTSGIPTTPTETETVTETPTETATPTPTSGPGDVTGNGNAATDPDGDGHYEDVNGNGEFDIVDVQALYAHRDSSVVQEHLDAFDYNDNAEVDIVDVQRLYVEEQAE